MRAGDDPRLIAFYGTLMRGMGGQDALGIGHRLRFLRPCHLPGRLIDLGDWPALVPGPGFVVGELFEIDDPALLALLDQFEDCDANRPDSSLYTRRRVRVDDGGDAWAYFYNGPARHFPVIPTGDWRRHRGPSPAR